jgi:spore germination protein
VRVGETVYRIAQQYGVTVDSIMAANGLADAAQLAAGSVLVIPVTGPT